MDNFSNQEEFLYILWHEITHVQERHIIRSIAFSSPLKLMMSYIWLGSWVNFDEMLKVGDLYLSRKDELSADIWGVKFVEKHWWNPKCASVFFSEEETESWSTFGRYLSTHPEHEERKNFIEKYDNKKPCTEIPY
jgi:predicted Zn-dependent protease